jgi:uncharacterized membrane protein YeaQ/YmgE (transglycosylase-associated protein family)
MSLLMAIVVGLAVGIVGTRLQKAGDDIAVTHVIAAVAGSFFGLFAYFLATLGSQTETQIFSWLGLIFCVLGAFAGDFGFAAVQRLTVKHTEKKKEVSKED